jgi:tRNA threonylcarbamoyladenosine biosynthesis protein TsaE
MVEEITVLCPSPAKTEALAEKVALCLHGGMVVSLQGCLGAGKTLFVKAMARALGVSETVTSPTFVLQKCYETRSSLDISQLIHYDFYRIGYYDELVDIGFEDIPPNALILAEWGNRFASEFPHPPLVVELEGSGDDPRTVTILSQNPAHEQIIETLRQKLHAKEL